jgi:hypothetical protein
MNTVPLWVSLACGSMVRYYHLCAVSARSAETAHYSNKYRSAEGKNADCVSQII